MKKLIIIVSVFAVLLAGMICEMVFVNDYYSKLQLDLEKVKESIDLYREDLDNETTVSLCENVSKKWEDGKKWLLLIQNHNTVRNFDDKIVSLVEVVKSGNYNDAVIFVNSAINYIDDVLLDSIPFISNIL
ncbi:MAG: DUF4363 family protein [Clostridiales bacterium]|nr:DUF4363 family protein [Clostridiales bacterium]